MPWDRKKRKDDIGYKASQSGKPVLEWHERAPGRVLLASRVLETGKPSVIIASRPETKDVLYKCPGSGGFKAHADFEKEQLCRKCQHRSSDVLIVPLHDSGSFTGDLAGFPYDNDRWHVTRRALVPSDCPCAGNIWGHDRAYARSIGLSTDSVLVPKAWKLTWDGQRLRLSFHYRRLYFSPSLKLANDGFFQHIVADLDSGKTYVTAVSDGSRQARKKPRAADDITYSGQTQFLDSISPTDLEGALVVMQEHLRRLLEERDYKITESKVPSLNWLAATNRYPMLGERPFPLRWLLPDRLQRVVSRVPRETDVSGIVEYLGITGLTEEGLVGCRKYPAAMGNLMILKDLGCDDPKVLSLACDPECAVDVTHFFHKILAGCRAEGVCGIDALEMMLPRVHDAEGWEGIISDMEQMGSEAAHRGSTWINSFAATIASAAMCREFPEASSLRQMVSELNEWKAAVMGNSAEALYPIDKRENASFRCAKRAWKVHTLEPAAVMVSLSGANAYRYGAQVYQEFLLGRKAMFLIEDVESGGSLVVEAERYLSLDRRKYRGTSKKMYREGTENVLLEDAVSCTYKILRVSEPMSVLAEPPQSGNSELFKKAVSKWATKHYIDLPERL